VQVEKPNLDIRFDEETLFHLITRMKMRGREKLDAAAAGGAKVFNFHLFKQHKYSYK
jgi:chemotaxis receptor (MCP) glutamine deamidase CheD